MSVVLSLEKKSQILHYSFEKLIFLLQFCSVSNNHDYLPYCVKSWMRRCGAEMHVEIAKRVFLEPWQQSIREFCDSKGTIRPSMFFI